MNLKEPLVVGNAIGLQPSTQMILTSREARLIEPSLSFCRMRTARETCGSMTRSFTTTPQRALELRKPFPARRILQAQPRQSSMQTAIRQKADGTPFRAVLAGHRSVLTDTMI